MAEIKRGNWSFRDPGDDVPDGSTISGGNFMQAEPETAILAGKTLTITGGNWTNVTQQPGWTVTGGNWTQVELCCNLHPNIAAHVTTPCVEVCSHVTETDEIYIDGELVETMYTYGDSYQ